MKKTQKKMIRQMSKVITNDLIKMIESIEVIQKKAEKKERKARRKKAEYNAIVKHQKPFSDFLNEDQEDEDEDEKAYQEYLKYLQNRGDEVDREEYNAPLVTTLDRYDAEKSVVMTYADRVYKGQVNLSDPLPKLSDVLTAEDISYLEKTFTAVDIPAMIRQMDEEEDLLDLPY